MEQDFGKDSDEVWYLFVRGLMIRLIEKFPKSCQSHFFYAYILNEKLNNTYKCLIEMMVTENLKPTYQEEFCLFSYKHTLESKIIEKDMRDE